MRSAYMARLLEDGADLAFVQEQVGMAARGMYATTDLRPLLTERGFELSQSQVYRLVAERPEWLNSFWSAK
ncbi:hypothetical protein [Sphaerisporangium sp. NPDC051011]|uniref:hypothetical protein n=1 Tax=Sphaerisporangium sp. NPDC051011 TaxID=3155792 RepID=UPI0033CE9222